MIGVIADDLTGAAEIGAVGLRHGLRAEIIVMGGARASEFPSRAARVRKPSEAGTANRVGAADLICVDTDSRSCAAAESGRRAAAAARLLRAGGAHWIYKKVDSVLRGQVTAEIEAVMKELRLNRALLVPANPSLGRTIQNGRYFVRGTPIHKTEFARDPQHPRTSAKVLDLLKRSRRFGIHVGRASEPCPAAGIVIGEVASANDLQQWAARRDDKILCAGGAEFFAAVLGTLGSAGIPAGGLQADRLAGKDAGAPRRRFMGRQVFVCGTMSASARAFLRAMRSHGTPVFSLPRELASGARFTRAAVDAIADRATEGLGKHPRVILSIDLPPIRRPSAAKSLVNCLVRLAEVVLREAGVGHVYAEGGATAVALVQRMGWRRFTVVRELAPGVATLAVEGDASRLLTIKPGSYVWPAGIVARRRASPGRKQLS